MPRKASRLQRAQIADAKTRFLEAYLDLGNISLACRETRIGRRTHYDWLEADPTYAAAFQQAEIEAIEVLEGEAHRRAVKGVTEPIFHQGKQCGAVQKYSDVLLIFLLKAARPGKYRDRVEHTGPSGGPIEIRKVTFGGRYKPRPPS